MIGSCTAMRAPITALWLQIHTSCSSGHAFGHKGLTLQQTVHCIRLLGHVSRSRVKGCPILGCLQPLDAVLVHDHHHPAQAGWLQPCHKERFSIDQ